MTTTIDPTTLTVDELAPMLRAWAGGLYTDEAAVELLIQHRTWLRRRDFVVALVDAVVDGWGPQGVVVPMASIDWEGVEAFLDEAPASRSEICILRLAASLAGAQVAGSLRDLTVNLDDTNAALVLDALAHRYGWHERGRTQLVTGTFTVDRTDPATMHRGAGRA